MLKNMRNLTLLLFSLILITGCESYSQNDYEEFVVVESYQVGGRQLSQVRLSLTAPADEFYNFNEQALTNADVTVHLLAGGPNSAVEQSFTYETEAPGIYTATDSHLVIPEKTYMLEVTFPDRNEELSAFTTIPGDFEITGTVKDSVVYQSSDQLDITVTPSAYPGRQSVFVFNTISLQPEVSNLTPFFLDAYENGDEEVEFYAKNSSGIINEGNFDENPDGTFTLKYPWIGIAFYEDNLLVANTIDDNIYDFFRSQQVQLGGSTLSPGEIQNAIYHVSGGIGIFGSLASDTARTYIKRPDF